MFANKVVSWLVLRIRGWVTPWGCVTCVMCEPAPEQARELTWSCGSERAVCRKLPENPPVSSWASWVSVASWVSSWSPGGESSSRSRPRWNGLNFRIKEEVLRLTLRLDFLLEVMTMNGDKVSVSLTTWVYSECAQLVTFRAAFYHHI